MLYRNTRPTIIQRPNGKNIMPGETFTPEDGEMANPGMRKFAGAGYLQEVPSTLPPPPVDREKVRAERAAQAAKEAAARAVQTAKDASEKHQADLAKAKASDADTKAKAAQEKADKDQAAARAKDAAEKAGKIARDAKTAAVKTADAERLLKMAEGETDPTVMAAIEARATEIAPK